jgi:triacylglycerol esterase/lipase EstA (alpha/beta hydrolase family)
MSISALFLLGSVLPGGREVQAQVLAGGADRQSVSLRIGPEGGYLKDRGSSRVLVFVHGFSGEPDSDFRCDDIHNWPEMIAASADPTLASTDIYVIGYPPPPRRGKTAVAELEASLLDRLDAAGVFTRHQEVVFVAHAMGGLLIQQIIAANSEKDWTHKIRAVFLYGTPQGEAKLAGLGRYIRADPRLKEIEGNGNNFILQRDSPVWSGIPLMCAYETLSDDGFTALDYTGKTRGCTERLGVHANRANIVQPCRVDDGAYTFLEDKLRALFPPS